MKILKTIIISAIIGLGIGNLLNLSLSIIGGYAYQPGVPTFLNQFDSFNQAVLIEFILYAALGICQGLAGYIFQIEKRSIATTILSHYGLIMLPLVVVGAYLHWFPFHLWGIAGFLLIASLLYLGIGFFLYTSSKKDVETINAFLKKQATQLHK